MHISFATITVLDQDRAKDFYMGVLGMTEEIDAEPEGMVRWVQLGLPGGNTSLVLFPGEGVPDTDMPVLVLAVEDLHALEATLTGAGAEAGAEVTQPVAPAPWNEEALHLMFRDTEGNLVLATQS